MKNRRKIINATEPNKKVVYNTFLSEFKMSIEPELKANANKKIKVVFEVSEEGQLRVTATDTKTDNSISMDYSIKSNISS